MMIYTHVLNKDGRGGRARWSRDPEKFCHRYSIHGFTKETLVDTKALSQTGKLALQNIEASQMMRE